MEPPQIALGHRLRQARLDRGLTIGEVSALTKISTRALLAIEREDFDRLPRGIFRRAYVTAYADAVGLDGRECGRAYVEAFEPPPPEAPVEQGSGLSQTMDWISGHAVGLSVGLVAASALALAIRPVPAQRSTADAEVASSVSSFEASVEPTPVATATSAANVAAIDDPGLVRVRVTASADCWISAVADGVRVWHGQLGPGQKLDVEAKALLRLRVGDAGAATYTIDGAPAKVLGAPGKPATVVLTPETAERFLLSDASTAL